MKVAVASETPAREQNREQYSPRTGAAIMQRLLDDDAPDGLNFRIVRSRFQPGDKAFRSPRHHHAFQQLRFTEQGVVNHAPGLNAAEGDITYFPKAAYYGPQEKDNGVGIAVQWGFNGEHQMGGFWDELRPKALELLNSRGHFEEGVYIQVDPKSGEKSRQDSVQALYEAQYELHTGEKFVVPPEGYQSPILMHPANFAYYQSAPGVELKHLGRFYDQPGPNGDVHIAMARLSNGGTHKLDPARAQLGWAIQEGLILDGRSYPDRTFFYSPRGEALDLSSGGSLEVYIIEFPRLD